ncbi:MAG: fluoride efflux transporter CrcB [Chloroflexota bacterium]
MRFVAVSLGGVLGANARYLVGTWAATHLGPELPYGTIIVNVTGSVLVGLLLTLVGERFPAAPPILRLFFVVGFLGAYTTFSAYAWETVQLATGGNLGTALVNAVGSVVLGVVGVFAGVAIARQF